MVDEKNNPFDDKRLDKIIELIFSFPFEDYDEMCLDSEEYYFIPFNKSALLDKIKGKSEFSIRLKSGANEMDFEGKLKISLNAAKSKNSFGILIDNDDYFARGSQQFLRFVKDLAKLFTKIKRGITHEAEFNHDKYYKKYKLQHIGPCFARYVHWVHILGKEEYALNGFKKDVLLQSPAFLIEEWDNDVIYFQSYEKPFSWDTPETVSQIKLVNQYLLENVNYEDW